ncbi:hypothetical protein GCM10010182_82860 [Actinomadura cremea]|nr:hypothetical protein GCM10010182_82860 [Actinomadura cremea]
MRGVGPGVRRSLADHRAQAPGGAQRVGEPLRERAGLRVAAREEEGSVRTATAAVKLRSAYGSSSTHASISWL